MTRWAMVAGLACLLSAGCDDGDSQPVDGGDVEEAGDEGTGETGAEDGAGDGEDVEAGETDGADDGGPGCGNGLVEPGEECDDGNVTAGDGCEEDCVFSCHENTDCEDGLLCTDDHCNEVLGGQACRRVLLWSHCLIGGACYAEGEADPTRPCMTCDPGADAGYWTPLAEGTSCDDGLFCNGVETCTADGDCVALSPACPGGCVDSCDESGDACIPAATSTVCRPSAGPCDADDKCDGASFECPPDELEDAGTVCRLSLGECDPEEVCTGTEAACPADVVLPEGTACDDLLACSLTDACDAAGMCIGTSWLAPGVPTPYLPQNGTRTGAGPGSLRPMFRWMDPPWDGCLTPTYELQVDDSCTAPGLASCAFDSPEIDATGISGAAYVPSTDLPVGTTAPVGRRYYWRVRACRGTLCSAWSTVRYFDVGRALQDFDGDGYSDVVVGATSQDATAVDEGAAFVYHGSAAGLASTPARTLTNPDHTAGGGFGLVAAAVGDLNADGFIDLAVGAPNDDLPVSNGGRVFVYLGSAAGIPATPTAILANPDLQAEGLFGVAVAGAGDVNGDGFDDLVVGAYRQDGASIDQGAAWIYLGSASGVGTTPDVALPAPGEQAGAQFGRSVAGAGDLNADGFGDVVVGAPYHDNGATDEGAAYVFLGSAAGPASAPSVSLDNPVNQPDAHFGWSVASAGDINVNGYSELLVGAPVQANPTAGEGNVFVYYGTVTGVPTYPSGTFDNPDAQDGGFGFSAAGVGDVNGDVNPDVAIGALYQDNGATNEGNAFLYNGCYCGVIRTATPTTVLDNPDNQAEGLFGQSVSGAGDVNRDGFADVVVGALTQDEAAVNEGMVFVYLGSATGLPTTPSLRLADPGDEASALFGSWVD